MRRVFEQSGPLGVLRARLPNLLRPLWLCPELRVPSDVCRLYTNYVHWMRRGLRIELCDLLADRLAA